MDSHQGLRPTNGSYNPYYATTPDMHLANPMFKTPPASASPSTATMNPPWTHQTTTLNLANPGGAPAPQRQNSNYQTSYDMAPPPPPPPSNPSHSPSPANLDFGKMLQQSPLFRQQNANVSPDYDNVTYEQPRDMEGGANVMPRLNRQISSPNDPTQWTPELNGSLDFSPPPPPPAPPGPSNSVTLTGSAPPPPPPPPPLPGSAPTWKEKQQSRPEANSGYHPSQNAASTPDGSNQPFSYLPQKLQSAMNKDKKPFTYTPGGIDLSEIRSPRMARRISANQQNFPVTGGEDPPTSPQIRQVVQADVHAADNSARGMSSPSIRTMQPVLPPFDPSQSARQLEGLNLHGGAGSPRVMPCSPLAYGPQDGYSSLPRNYQQMKPQFDPNQERTFPQSKSFKILQMVTGTDADKESEDNTTDTVNRKPQEDEMRFTGLRRDQIPSRSFQALQRMTDSENVPAEPARRQGYQSPSVYEQPHQHKPPSEGPDEEGPVDIRYVGGNIPSRSFKMLQDMTETGVMPPSVWQAPPGQQPPTKRTSRVQIHPIRIDPRTPEPPPPQMQPKFYPHPEVPASKQQTDPEPRKYAGGRIPSQSFKILQAMTGEDPTGHEMDGTDF